MPSRAGHRIPHDHEGEARDRPVRVNGIARPHTWPTAWTGLVGTIYLPSTVVPVGFATNGLPVGMQVVASRWHDKSRSTSPT